MNSMIPEFNILFSTETEPLKEALAIELQGITVYMCVL